MKAHSDIRGKRAEQPEVHGVRWSQSQSMATAVGKVGIARGLPTNGSY